MFVEELKPIAQEAFKQPVAFLGGFVSGILKLNMGEEPLKSWLEKQGDFSIGKNSQDIKPETINIE